MFTYFQITTDMTMTTMTEGLNKNNIQLYTKTTGRSRGPSIIQIIPIWGPNSFIFPCVFAEKCQDLRSPLPHATENVTGQHDTRI